MAEFDQLVQRIMNDWKVPGLAIAIVQADKVYTKGYGFAQFPETRVTADTLFDTASMSKSFTAAAVALLVHDNDKYLDVQWATPVSKLLQDDFLLEDPQYTEHVTIEDILSHRSGMPGHDDSCLGVNAAKPDSPKSTTRNLRNLPLSRPLRTEYQYSNIMYVAASYMVEVLSRETFAEFLKSRIWNPLNMTNTYLDIAGVESHNATERLARAYRWDEKADSYVGIPWFRQPEAQGSGSVYSSVKDYGKWIQAMINRTSPLPPDTYTELIKPRTIMPEDEEDRVPFHSQSMYALGWVVESYRGRQVIGHGGSDCGFESLMQYLPELGWGIVVLGNSNGAGDAAWILYGHLVDELLGVPNSERFDWATRAREKCAKDKEAEEQHLFPERPHPPLPMSAPILDFTGRYHNSGYHDLVLVIKDGNLQADCSDRTLGSFLVFEHVSGNSFIAEMRDLLGDKRRMKAEFVLDEGGHVTSVGVAFVTEMEDERIWFRKIGWQTFCKAN